MLNSSVIHHVSVINRDIEQTFRFYHKLLGLDLLLKTVNQDDVEMYHLFFGDTKGRPGTEFTVFQMKDGVDRTFGTNAIERTVFAVPTVEALYFWEKRLNENDVFNCEIEDYNDSKILRFEDFDGVQLGMVPIRDTINDFFPRETAEISLDNVILGIDSVHLRVRYPLATSKNMQRMFGLEVTKNIHQGSLLTTVLSKDNTLFNQEIHIIEDKMSSREVLGIGSAHHIALSVKDTSELSEIEQQVIERNFKNSGVKYREFFTSIYFREPNQLLFEVATEEISFTKEDYGSTEFDDIPLSLPRFLERKRESIESHLYK
ncbi:VOC family protein [Carnobacterium sp. CS13]|uniref:VOC family protein n=1 Tax=Carnobacterium sp. CS13 TaxID=2800128 RepID=UPI0019121F31|nr:VOC family protein [Carnobacterium sp. CS13]QQP70117.1 VOC family protein [Carnobacterium sp. CS13]